MVVEQRLGAEAKAQALGQEAASLWSFKQRSLAPRSCAAVRFFLSMNLHRPSQVKQQSAEHGSAFRRAPQGARHQLKSAQRSTPNQSSSMGSITCPKADLQTSMATSFLPASSSWCVRERSWLQAQLLLACAPA